MRAGISLRSARRAALISAFASSGEPVSIGVKRRAVDPADRFALDQHLADTGDSTQELGPGTPVPF